MDAVEYIKEYRKMCNQYAYSQACGEDCSWDCPLYGEHCNLSCNDLEADYVVFKVETWSKSNFG